MTELLIKDFVKDDLSGFFGIETKSVFDLLGSNLKNRIDLLFKEKLKNEQIIKGNVESGAVIKGRVYIESGVTVESGAYINGPAYINENTEIRHGAYIRGNVYIGKNCVVGHVCEVKNSCFFDGAKAGHFSYIGDSLLAEDVNLGAGTKLANLKFDRGLISYKDPFSNQKIKTNLNKFGSILGYSVQTGCNSVLSPGSIILPNLSIMPCVHFHGTLKK